VSQVDWRSSINRHEEHRTHLFDPRNAPAAHSEHIRLLDKPRTETARAPEFRALAIDSNFLVLAMTLKCFNVRSQDPSRQRRVVKISLFTRGHVLSGGNRDGRYTVGRSARLQPWSGQFRFRQGYCRCSKALNQRN
jgi:hypothetical protein